MQTRALTIAPCRSLLSRTKVAYFPGQKAALVWLFSLSLIIAREHDRYIAQCLEVDVSSFGNTQDEALAMVTEALELWFEETTAPTHVVHPVVTTVDVQIAA